MIRNCERCNVVFSAFATEQNVDAKLCNDCFVIENELTRREEAEFESNHDMEGLE